MKKPGDKFVQEIDVLTHSTPLLLAARPDLHVRASRLACPSSTTVTPSYCPARCSLAAPLEVALELPLIGPERKLCCCTSSLSQRVRQPQKKRRATLFPGVGLQLVQVEHAARRSRISPDTLYGGTTTGRRARCCRCSWSCPSSSRLTDKALPITTTPAHSVW